MIILGIDEAGRGPVIGPMVMAAVSIDEKEEFKLDILGVRDSKQLTPSQREKIYKGIVEMAKEHKIKIIDIEEIDNAVNSEETNLNWLEADKIAEFINTMKADKVFIDCPSNNLKEYKGYIQRKINKKVELIVEHKADENYLVVGAASIIAKCTRDKQIQKLKEKHKVNFGSGYPSDPFTIQFLESNYNKYPIFRKSWASWKKVALKKNQKRLSEF